MFCAILGADCSRWILSRRVYTTMWGDISCTISQKMKRGTLENDNSTFHPSLPNPFDQKPLVKSPSTAILPPSFNHRTGQKDHPVVRMTKAQGYSDQDGSENLCQDAPRCSNLKATRKK